MSAAPPVLLQHPSSLDHDTGPHPEQPARMVAIERELAARGYLGYERVSSPAVGRSVLEAVHPARHVERVERMAARGGARIDADTVVSAGSFTAAVHACGGAVSLADRLVDGERAHRLLDPPPARAPRRGRAGDGLLPVQQRRRRGPARPGRARPGAGDDRRLGRPSRQRDQRHLPCRAPGAVLLDPPVAALSGHGPGVRRRLGSRAGVHRQPAGGPGVGRPGVPLAHRPRRGAAGAIVCAATAAGLSRVRRPCARTRWPSAG